VSSRLVERSKGRKSCLGIVPIHPVLLSTDLAETKRFYHDKLDLEILSEGKEAIVFRSEAELISM
jgi:extradiol dioxygenase family protein